VNRLGPEDYQSNRHIRKILRLAGATRRDVFYDLGCGRGQLCVVAVTEFGVRKAVGIELHRGRAAKAAAHVQALGLSDRIEIWNEDYMDSDLGEATIAYCGHTETEEDLPRFEEQLGAGSRFVSLFLPFVGVVPAAVDYPFYLMKLPFRRTEDASLWISKVLSKKATLKELYEELDTDREYRYDKRLLTRLMGERFPGLRAAHPDR
jgi:predicted RNA methylase